MTRWQAEDHDLTDATVVMDGYGDEICQVFGTKGRRRKRVELIAAAPEIRDELRKTRRALAILHDFFSAIVEDGRIEWKSVTERKRMWRAFDRSTALFDGRMKP